ncbi:hypothetical protein HDV01_001707, partial [Terramyces sp. JEL0728]
SVVEETVVEETVQETVVEETVTETVVEETSEDTAEGLNVSANASVTNESKVHKVTHTTIIKETVEIVPETGNDVQESTSDKEVVESEESIDYEDENAREISQDFEKEHQQSLAVKVIETSVVVPEIEEFHDAVEIADTQDQLESIQKDLEQVINDSFKEPVVKEIVTEQQDVIMVVTSEEQQSEEPKSMLSKLKFW